MLSVFFFIRSPCLHCCASHQWATNLHNFYC